MMIALLAVTVGVLMVLHLYVFARAASTDDGGFMNPILEYVHYGRVVYPAHGFPQSMAVHPPVHYWLAGVLIKAGLNFYPAVETLPLFFGTIAILSILTAPFRGLLKASL
jgi:hypothetical protein